MKDWFRRIGGLAALALLVVSVCLTSAAPVNLSKPIVDSIHITGAIDPAMALYVDRGVQAARADGAQALVVLIDTPGGLSDSMRSIIKDFLASDVPIVVYVWPRGARAASAGAIITLAANIAAMSPGTNIGAAHPVGVGGGNIGGTEGTKVENDAAAFARSVATQRGRNVHWAELVVRKSISSTEREAKDQHVIDIIAADQADLLRQLDGRKVTTASGTVILHTRNSAIRAIPPSFREGFLHVIDDPNIAYILMILAVYGIIFELSNPGAILPGVVGGISLILALFSLAVLPVSLTGVLLIVFAIILFLADLHAPTHGVLTLGGIIAFLSGSLFLFGSESRVAPGLILGATGVTAAFFIFAVGSGIRAQKRKVVTGKEGMIGKIVPARTDIAPTGKIFADGAYWNAVTEGEPIKQGELVSIVGVEGLTVKVKKA